MRSGEEVREAIAILGASFASAAMHRFVGGERDREAERAWVMFQVLGWVAGAEDPAFSCVLANIATKIELYAQETEYAD